MLREVPLPQAYRATPTGLFLISTAHNGKRNVQFAFRALGTSEAARLSYPTSKNGVAATKSWSS